MTNRLHIYTPDVTKATVI